MLLVLRLVLSVMIQAFVVLCFQIQGLEFCSKQGHTLAFKSGIRIKRWICIGSLDSCFTASHLAFTHI